MPVNSDFRDLFAALNAEGARYLVIGGYAFAHHARPRYTKDLDLWVDAASDNAERVKRALDAFGAPAGFTEDDLRTPDMIVMFGVPPNRIDILTSVEGLAFDECWKRRVATSYGDVPIDVLSRPDLIVNKRAVGRPQDLRDVEELERC